MGMGKKIPRYQSKATGGSAGTLTSFLFFTWRSCPASPRLFAPSLAAPNSPISESYAQRKKLTIYFIYSKISVVLMSVSGLVDVCCDSQTEGLGFDPPT